MTAPLPTLVLSRRPRTLAPGWHDASSWFGGAPQLGAQPWPRGGRRAPMYFVAQLDLAEVRRAVACAGGSLPAPDGALAFFLGSDDRGYDTGAVVHVPRAELGRPTAPPPDARVVLAPCGYPFPESFDETAPRLFRHWPVDVTALNLAPTTHLGDDDEANEARWAEQVAAVERHFPRPEYEFSAGEAYALLGEAPRPHWWHTAHQYAACLREALRGAPAIRELRRARLDADRAALASRRPGGVEGFLLSLGIRLRPKGPEETRAEAAVARSAARLVDFDRLAPEFERFVREVEDWARGTDPWAPMPPEAAARLRATVERGRAAFDDMAQVRLEGLETSTLLALATGDDPAYATVPEPVRTLINTQHRLPPEMWHQMFGRGVDIQGNAADENAGNVMLLQLVYDGVMDWRFGDVGAYQFWIPPGGLAAGRWAAVRVTFEGH